MYTHEREALEHIASELRRVLGDVIAGVYAFGSRVRGDHTAWSDFDVLIIISKKDTTIEQKIIGIIVDIETEYGLSFSPVIKTTGSYEKEKKFNSPFYQNITKEAIAL
jgi:predicted nucleotidyltransferase